MIASRYIRFALGLLLMMSLIEVTDAQRPGRWIFLGEASVDGRFDRDRIIVGRDRGRFRWLQIRVDRAPIEFQRVVVNYANGRSEDIGIRQRINPGGQTRAIDLRGDNRGIISVDFWYARGGFRPWRQQPRVRLFGS